MRLDFARAEGAGLKAVKNARYFPRHFSLFVILSKAKNLLFHLPTVTPLPTSSSPLCEGVYRLDRWFTNVPRTWFTLLNPDGMIPLQPLRRELCPGDVFV